ncbi:MAG: hypothetical protein R3C28_17215 [Pirellulaceae bacterium]
MLWANSTPFTWGQHQTLQFSPVLNDGVLPYELQLVPLDIEAELPTLHSFAHAQWDGKWLLLSGRTNGLHDFTQNGFINFPPAHQNRDVWVVDPNLGQTWRRSLQDVAAGLTVEQVDSIAVTNNQFYQSGPRLYLSGGYGFRTDDEFTTFDALTAIDVPGLMDWVINGNDVAANHIRQIHDPLFTVTGGAMLEMDGRTQLVFGQDFQGDYTQFGNGVYTNQVRSFTIVDDGHELSVTDVTWGEQRDEYRRRDLNVLPFVATNDDGDLASSLVALSGVFTEAGGVWSVPVEIDADGSTWMEDPDSPFSFRQPLNNYHSAKFSMFSESTGENHLVLWGGIGLFTTEDGQLVRDDLMPFGNDSSVIVRNADGVYSQHALPSSFPEMVDANSGRILRFGANAEFLVSPAVPTEANGVIRLDSLPAEITLGHIVGGIVADLPHRGNSAASGQIFEVIFRRTNPWADFNIDGVVDVLDVNLVSAAIDVGSPSIEWDIDQSGQLNADDLKAFANDVLGTWLGDANLDGQFGTSDLVQVFQAGEYEDSLLDNSTWETGDWNGDREFNSADFVAVFQAGGFEHGLRTTVDSVPEALPPTLVWICVGLVLCKCRSRE